MDVLRKELNEIYCRQHLDAEDLPNTILEQALKDIATFTAISQSCTVLTDIAHDKSWIFPSTFSEHIGIRKGNSICLEVASSDEDIIYTRMHPEDLVDKRMLEYKLLTYTESLNKTDKTLCKALCRIRIQDENGIYLWVDNTTQILQLSPAGRMWLFLCTYRYAESNEPNDGIQARIINYRTGEIQNFSFSDHRQEILSPREKEILLLIKQGMLSKEIAVRLHISINTVNRHRQNILQKLSVNNFMEAVNAATVMRLL